MTDSSTSIPTIGDGAAAPNALEIFRRFLAHADVTPIESYVDEYPSLADELRRLHADWCLGVLSESVRGGNELSSAAIRAGSAAVDRIISSLRNRDPDRRRFRIVGEVLEHPLGTILEVQDEILLRRVTRKVASEASRDTATRQLTREARIAGGLRHPCVPPVHDFGFDESGRLQFTMKHVTGESLQSLCDAHHAGDPSWSRERLLRVIVQVCEALAHAHDVGITHGRLSPAGILVGQFGETYLLGWGETTPGGDAAQDLVGTTHSPRASSDDIKAAGGLLETLLFERDPGQSARILGTRRRRSKRVPARLAAIVTRATAIVTTERYATMNDLAADLRAYLEDRVVRAHATGPIAELRAWLLRNRTFASTIAASVVAVSTAFAYFFAKLDEEKRVANDFAARVFLLADAHDSAMLLAEAERLWPLEIELEPRWTTWLDRAESLIAHRSRHQESLDGLLDVAPESLDDDARAWWRDTLATILERIDALDADSSPGNTRAGIRARRDLARTVAAESGIANADLWNRTCAEIRTDPLYSGLVLEPQRGLIPLGRDPDSRLFEFAHRASGTVPTRDPRSNRLRVDAATGVVLVLLPGGRYSFGSQNQDPRGVNYDPLARSAEEGDVVTIDLAPFFISKYELDQAQWQRMSGNNPSAYREGGLRALGNATPLHPVESVSWIEAERWLTRHGLELPTEVQWEYACRGGTDTIYWSGDSVESRQGAVNLADVSGLREIPELQGAVAPGSFDDGFAIHAPIDALRPNPFGLVHSLGNVSEWTRDPPALTSARRRAGDGLALESKAEGYRTDRGGCYMFADSGVRVAFRGQSLATTAKNSIGVRPSRSIEPARR